MRWQAAADASCLGQLLMKAAGQDGGNSEMFRKIEENIKKTSKRKTAEGTSFERNKYAILKGGGAHLSVQIRLYLASENLDTSSRAGSSSQFQFSY